MKVYEVRDWFDNCTCLYTDDRRIKDMAVTTPDLKVATSYFRNPQDHQAFAWDIVGAHDVLTGIATRFGSSKRSGRSTLAVMPHRK